MKDIANQEKNTKKIKNPGQSLFKKFKEYKVEFSKIVWVTKKELLKQTLNVLIICIIFFIIIFFMDFVFNKIIEIFSRILV